MKSRIFLLFITVIFILLLLGCSRKENDLDRMRLKGNINGITTTYYLMRDSANNFKDGYLGFSESITFDYRGMIMEYTTTNGFDTTYRELAYKHKWRKKPEREYMVERRNYSPHESIPYSIYRNYTEDDIAHKGHIARVSHSRTMGKKVDRQYAYDIFEKDKHGMILSVRHYDVDDSLLRNFTYVYNSKGQMTGFTAHTIPRLFELYSFKPDFTEFVKHSEITFLYSYDGKGNLTEEKADSIKYRAVYKTNEYGDPVSQTVYTNESKNTYTFNYVYDNKQNWIQCRSTSNGKPSKLIIRNITYK